MLAAREVIHLFPLPAGCDPFESFYLKIRLNVYGGLLSVIKPIRDQDRFDYEIWRGRVMV